MQMVLPNMVVSAGREHPVHEYMCCCVNAQRAHVTNHCWAERRQKQRHWAAEMEVKVEELTKIHDAVQAEQRSLAARRASLEVTSKVHRPRQLEPASRQHTGSHSIRLRLQ